MCVMCVMCADILRPPCVTRLACATDTHAACVLSKCAAAQRYPRRCKRHHYGPDSALALCSPGPLTCPAARTCSCAPSAAAGSCSQRGRTSAARWPSVTCAVPGQQQKCADLLRPLQMHFGCVAGAACMPSQSCNHVVCGICNVGRQCSRRACTSHCQPSCTHTRHALGTAAALLAALYTRRPPHCCTKQHPHSAAPPTCAGPGRP